MIFAIRSSAAPLYAEPDERSAQVDEVLHGMAVSVEAEEGEWLNVCTTYHYRGWINRTHLCLLSTCTQFGHNLMQYTTATTADVLTAPKVQAPLLICLPLGCTVCVIGEDVSGWTQIVLADNRNGYIRSDFLASFPKEADREALCQTARLYLGTQYRWGGKTSLGIDCSGLCFMAYWLNGVNIYRDARIEPGFPIKEISPAEAQKGDLLFFPGHVGMLLDTDTMIHSSEANNGVKIDTLTPDWMDRITAAGSIFNTESHKIIR